MIVRYCISNFAKRTLRACYILPYTYTYLLYLDEGKDCERKKTWRHTGITNSTAATGRSLDNWTMTDTPVQLKVCAVNSVGCVFFTTRCMQVAIKQDGFYCTMRSLSCCCTFVAAKIQSFHHFLLEVWVTTKMRKKQNTFVHIHDNTFTCTQTSTLYCFDLKDPTRSES